MKVATAVVHDSDLEEYDGAFMVFDEVSTFF